MKTDEGNMHQAMRRYVGVLFRVAVLSLIVVKPTSADPIVAVSGGWGMGCGIETCGVTGGEGVLRGPDLDVVFAPLFSLGASPLGPPQVGPSSCLRSTAFLGCAPGTPLSLNTILTGPFGAPSSVRIGTQEFGDVNHRIFMQGTMEFASRDVSTTPLEIGDFVVPFDLSASLTGYANQLFTGPPLFSVDITGQGHLTVSNGIRAGLLTTTGFFYRLEPVGDPTPEPTTLALVAGGLGLTAARKRRMSARPRPK